VAVQADAQADAQGGVQAGVQAGVGVMQVGILPGAPKTKLVRTAGPGGPVGPGWPG
jgi:hypothetical protein